MPSRGRTQLIIVALALLFFVPGLGAVHLFDWDEINFAEIAREMVITGNWGQPQIDFLPFHEKPPLFIWMQALSMKVFGIGEFAARFPNALCGVLTLLVLYRIGDQLRGKVFGMLWSLAYFGSILPHLYFRSGIIDPWFNLFIFLGIHALITLVQCDPDRRPGTLNARSDGKAALVGLFFGLAILTKGPVGVLIPLLVLIVHWVMGRFRPVLSWRRIGIIVGSTAITAGAWALVDLLRHGPDFIVGFFWRQVALLSSEDAGHGGFMGYHFVVLLIGCFPASVFAIQDMIRPAGRRKADLETSNEEQHQRRGSSAAASNYRKWMLILFWVVLILFSLVKTKIVHYSSLCYFPLTYLAALQLERIWKQRAGFGWSRFLLGGLGTLIALIFIVVPFVGMNIDTIKPLFAKDPFALGNLDAAVHWSGLEAIAGMVLLSTLLIGHWLHVHSRYRQSLLVMFGGTALFITTTLFFFINRIEGYSQRAAIDFFEARQDETCYVITKNYKSYAQLFYTRKQPVNDPRAHDEKWLLYGAIDRPVHVVCKITSAEEIGSIRTLTEIERKNGFVFYVRRP